VFDYTYGIRSVAEYMERARSEVSRLERLEDEALPAEREHEVRSASTQAGTTLWHGTDFVFAAPDPEAIRARSKVGGGDLKTFQERVRAACHALTLCWELTNGAKHFHKKAAAQVDEVTLSIAPAHFVLLPTLWRSEGRRRRAKIILPDGRRLRAAHVFRDAIGEWERLMRP